MSRFHDVTVLTRANNRQGIEEGLARLGDGVRPEFVYFDLSPLAMRLKKRLGLHKPYYHLWQRQARALVSDLLVRRKFDILHHITFATYRSTTAVWGFDTPAIWGPVGGVESVPASLLPWGHPKSLAPELLRNIDNSLELILPGMLRGRAQRSSLVLATTREMERVFRELGTEALLMPTVGVHVNEIPVIPREVRDGPLKLLYVGGLIALKGLDLLIEALAQSGTETTLTLIGAGPFRHYLERLVARLGLSSRVDFRGQVPRCEVLTIYSDFDLFMFPSLHDTGGFAVLEAMANSLPVVCLAVGGPHIAVENGGGLCVPVGSRKAVIRGLAEAIQTYDGNRGRLIEDGKTARSEVLANYDWDKKGDAMNQLYRQLCPPA